MPSIRTMAALLAAALLVAPACSGPGDDRAAADRASDAGPPGKASADVAATTVTVDRRGATVALPFGGALVFPAGAVDRPRTVTIQPVAPTGDDTWFAVGPFYALGPAGTPLFRPVEVTLPWSESLSWSGDGGGVHRVGLAWSADGLVWAARPSRIDPDDGALHAQLPRLGTVGAASFEPPEGACCLAEGGCAMATAAGCDGAFVGRGVPCDDQDGATCERLRCCADRAGHRFVLPGSCAGRIVANEACELVCCPTARASPLAMRIPRGDCAATTTEDLDACAPVCCRLADATAVRAGVMFADDCLRFAEGVPLAAVAPDVDDCPVCCADGWSRRPARACAAWREPAFCERACCETADGAARMAVGACLAAGGAVRPDLSCACADDGDCDDGNPCTVDRCHPKVDRCGHEPVLMPLCGDGCVTAPERCEHDVQCSHFGKGATCQGCRCR